MLLTANIKPAVLSALVLAFAGLGDAFLYAVLPVHALKMGVPLVWIGFLLSVNRFIRLPANQFFGWLFNRFGFRRITFLAAAFSVLTTFTYGVAAGIYVWVVARIVWGLCFSALRISSISYSLDHPNKGFSLGLSRGLQEMGPIMALWLGTFVMCYTNAGNTFIVLALCSLPALVLAYYLPEVEPMPVKYSFHVNLLPSTLNFLVFLTALVVEGFLLVVLSRLLIPEHSSTVELTAMVAFYMGYRRLCSVFVSPLAGKLADHVGINKLYAVATFFTLLSLAFILSGFVKTGLFGVFAFYSIASALAPGEAATGQTNKLKAIAANTTWKDLGAATGALLAGLLLTSNALYLTLLCGTIVLLAAFFVHAVHTFKQINPILKWK